MLRWIAHLAVRRAAEVATAAAGAGILMLAGGCATHANSRAPARAQHVEPAARAQTAAGEPNFDQAAVAALVFDPPVIQHDPPVELSRAPRQGGAFVGYEQLTTTYFYLRIDDRWRMDGHDDYRRRAITERVGVSYR